MRGVVLVAALLALVALTLSAPASLSYKVGDFHSYVFASQVQTGTQQSLGALSTMSGTVEVECQQITKDGHYMFAMNMYDVVVQAQNSESAPAVPAARALGYDMYFEQTPAGQIVNVWYQEGDAPYYVEVKLGAINSFHTSVIASGSTATVNENDVIGQHSSLYAAQVQSDSSLSLAKGFDQNDFSTFVDPTLKPSNIALKAQASTNVHPAGYIQATSVTQTVTLMTMDAPSGTTADGWDSLLTAQGSLGLKINPSAVEKRLGAPVTVERLASTAFVSGTLSSFGSLAASYSRSLSPAQSEISADDLLALVSGDKLQAVKLRRVAAYFRAHPEVVQATFEPLLTQETTAPRSVQRLFSVLASCNVPSAHDLLIRHGVLSPVAKTQLAAINTISTSQVGSPLVRSALWSLIKAEPALTSTVSRAAALAFGSVLSRSSMSVRKSGLKMLMSLKSAAAIRDDEPALRVVASAMYNSLPAPAPQGVPEPTPGSMPFNKTWSASVEYGSVNTIGANFAAEYFVGTNFDCNQNTFNYLALVSSNASANLFMYVQDVFNVRAVYGREGAQLIGNELYLQVFYKVIVDMQIPNEDCKAESYDVGSFTAPGVDVTYTLWVGCIPVVFEAGVDFEADLSWGWSICQNNLFAQVQATPQAKLTASASAQTDLLIVEGEVSFQADFDVSITPQAFVDGDKCSVGVDVTLTANPMQASVDAEYRHKQCEWWIFDCKWSDWTTDTLWSWSAPKDNEVLYSQTWPVKA